jgi:purine-nucleoside phosphorylase
MKKQLEDSIGYLKQLGCLNSEVGIVLGTGLGKLVEHVKIIQEISYADIPHFPVATVEFHKGKLIYGELEGKLVLVMQGRFHLYEGYSLQEVTYPIRVLKALGIHTLLISNAAGAMNPAYSKGDLMLLDDHINLQGSSPLAFGTVEEYGERFVDMSAPYDQELLKVASAAAKKLDIPIHTGIYAGVVGPQLETRAEYRMLRIIGADAVGMSTIPEVIVARHLALRVLAVSVLTDVCDPENLKPINIPEIIKIVGDTEPQMVALFKHIIKE